MNRSRKILPALSRPLLHRGDRASQIVMLLFAVAAIATAGAATWRANDW